MSDGQRVQLRSDSAVVEILLHGAHVTTWQDAGRDVLFLSEKAILDGSRPVRGGIPIIFPQFGGRGPLNSHGFARNTPWRLSRKHADGVGLASAEFSLDSNAATRRMWPQEFSCSYSVELSGGRHSRLRCSLSVRNDNKREPFELAVAFHSYFVVEDIARTTVAPLAGVTYIDQLRAMSFVEQQDDSVRFTGETDRMYLDTPERLRIADAAGQRTIHCRKSTSLPDAVVWNPWSEKSRRTTDLGDEEYLRMVCVEAAALGYQRKLELAAGAQWNGWIELSVTHTGFVNQAARQLSGLLRES